MNVEQYSGNVSLVWKREEIFSELFEDFEDFKENELLEKKSEDLQSSSGGQLVNSEYFLEVSAKANGICNCDAAKIMKIPLVIYKTPEISRKYEYWRPKLMETKALVVNEANFYVKQNRKLNH